MRKIKKNDDVIVIAGKDKGKRGNVMKVVDDDLVIVEGVNMVKRHTRPNPNLGQPGGIIEQEKPIQVSNVAIFNASAGKADRVGFKILDDGRKVRIYKSSSEVIDS